MIKTDEMMPMKLWRIKEAQRLNLSQSAISNRIHRGEYRGKLIIKRKNKRVVFVADKKTGPIFPTGIEAQVCADIAARQKKGIAKYGTTVEQNPANLAQWLQHAYEECLDQAIYLRRAIEEQKKAP